MFRAFNMVLEPRAGRCCFEKTEEVLELFIGLLHLNCRMAVSGMTIPVELSLHTPCCLSIIASYQWILQILWIGI